MSKKIQNNSFFGSFQPIIKSAQVFGHFANLYGVNETKDGPLWRRHHPNLLLTIFLVSGNLVYVVLYSYDFIYDATYTTFHVLFFYIITLSMTISLMRVSTLLPALCVTISKMEAICGEHGNPKSLARKVKAIFFSFMLIAAVEHFTIIGSRIDSLMDCLEQAKNSYDFFELIQAFFRRSYSKIYFYTGYHLWAGFLLFPLNVALTFTWNFPDLFIGLIGIYISSRLKQFNEKLQSNQSKEKTRTFWHQARLEFDSISKVTKKADQTIGNLIILTIMSNIFFICIQLFQGFVKPLRSYYNFYYFWSLGFLLARSLFSSFCLAEVHTHSRRAMSALFSVSPSSYCVDVQRLLLQMNYDVVAFSGKRFFAITRGVILTVAGTIFSYEVILIQFTTPTSDENEYSNKSFCF